jgi:hypothetical protein
MAKQNGSCSDRRIPDNSPGLRGVRRTDVRDEDHVFCGDKRDLQHGLNPAMIFSRYEYNGEYMERAIACVPLWLSLPLQPGKSLAQGHLRVGEKGCYTPSNGTLITSGVRRLSMQPIDKATCEREFHWRCLAHRVRWMLVFSLF